MMKNFFLICTGILLGCTTAQAQKFYTKSGRIDFNATAVNSLEKIEAVNNTVTCVLDAATGAIQFSLLIKSFTFERALMQDHFNENYLESDTYPKAEFKGTISNNSGVDYTKDGDYAVTVTGKLTLHGQTHDVTSTGKISVQGDIINTSASFSVLLSDYKVQVPALVSDKVSKTATIKVACSLETL